jgi:hypothetical protein
MSEMLKRLHHAVNVKRPDNGFIRRHMIECGWTAQPAYRK